MNAESILPFLCELLVKSCAILLVAALLVRLWRRATAAQRHLIWSAAIVTTLLLPMTRLVAPWWAVPLQREAKISVPLNSLPLAPVAISSAAPAAETPIRHASNWTLPDWRKVLLGTWLGGAIFILGYRWLGSWRLRRLEKSSATLADARVLGMADRVLCEFHIDRRIGIQVSDECLVPMTWGVWRSVLMLPAGALAWSDSRLLAALRHEAGHISRRDYLVRWMAHLVCAVYWPNPLVWFAVRSLRVAQEQATDDLVLCAGTSPEDYAAQLFDAARAVGERGFFARHAVAMASPSTLEGRVLSILDDQRKRLPLSRLAAVMGSMLVALTLAVCTAAQLQGADPASASTPGTKSPADAGQKEPQIEIAAKLFEIASVPAKDDAKAVDLVSVYSDPQFQVIVRGLSQKKGVDLISSPTVTTRSKQRAEIEEGREFRYATDWEKDSAAGGWKPKTFAKRHTGVKLDVTPAIQLDGSIEIHMTPSFVQFNGYVDLDEQKSLANQKEASKSGDDPATNDLPATGVAPQGHRLKAVFAEQRSEKKVTLQSGQTAAFSQDLRADRPGAAPIVSRMVIFVTARIIDPAPKESASGESQKESAIQKVQTEKLRLEKEKLSALQTGKATPPAITTGSTLTLLNGTTLNGATTSTLTITGTVSGLIPSDSAALKKATKIILPKVEMREATVTEAIDFLRVKAVELDPEKKGVNLILKPGPATDARITLSLTDVPLIEALRYVAGLSELELRVESAALVLQPPGGGAKVNAKPAAAAAAADPSGPPVELTADSTRMENGVAIAEGHASVRGGDQTITADFIRYDPTTRRVELKGHVKSKSGLFTLEADSLTVWLDAAGKFSKTGPVLPAYSTVPPADPKSAGKIAIPSTDLRDPAVGAASREQVR